MSVSFPIWLKSYRQGTFADGLVTPQIEFTPQTEEHPLQLSGSVGKGGDNSANDVQKIKQRLKDLGYNIPTVNGTSDSTLIDQIKLFQGIINQVDHKNSSSNDGRVDVDGTTHNWLRAANAPEWIKVQDLSGPGWVNENQDTTREIGYHGYCTNWLKESFDLIGQHFIDNRKSSMIGKIAVNDCSPEHGGHTPDHSGHETGLQVDIRTPKIDKTSGGINIYVGVTDNNKNVSEETGRTSFTQTHSSYDRDANRQILKSIRAVMGQRIKGLYLNDFVLIDEGLCTYSKGHYDHVHLTIKPPQMEKVSSSSSASINQDSAPVQSTPQTSNPPTQNELYDFYRNYVYPLSADPNKFTEIDGHVNICGIRGWKAGFTVSQENNFNQFNDIIALIWKDGSNHYVKEFVVSVDPGKRRNLPNEKGLAHLMAKNSSAGTTGQYSYQIGTESGHTILKQKQAYVPVWREKDIENLQQNIYTNQIVDSNARGIHFIPGNKKDVVGSISYGQQTIKPESDYPLHKTSLRFEDPNWLEFIQIIESATDLGNNPQTEFIYTLMTGSEIPNLNTIDWGAAWSSVSNSWDWLASNLSDLYDRTISWMSSLSIDSDSTPTLPPLKLGDKGEDVRNLQRGLKLIDAGDGVTVNGTFDTNTEGSVKRVQGKFGWSKSGKADSKFMNMIAWAAKSTPSWTHSDSTYNSVTRTPSSTVNTSAASAADSGNASVLASIWNDFGGLINELSKDSGISPRIIVAILKKESNGNFVTTTPSSSSSVGKPLSRFENHVFFDAWGVKSTTNKDAFDDFFKPQSGWQNHEFNTGSSSSPTWTTLHTSVLSEGANQERQWLAIQKAEDIATEAAAYGSASYGGPQILGSKYSRVGYASAKEFADALTVTSYNSLSATAKKDNLTPHIFALFDFLRSNYWKYHGNLFALTEDNLSSSSTIQYKGSAWNRWEYFGYLYNGKKSYGAKSNEGASETTIRYLAELAEIIGIPMEGS